MANQFISWDERNEKSLKILCVDDEENIGKVMVRVLTYLNHEAHAVSSGEEAMEKLRGEHYDLVVTDFEMPGMNGLELAEKIKSRHDGCPVILLTGCGLIHDEKNNLLNRIDAVLFKPVTIHSLQSGIARLFETNKNSVKSY